MQAIWTFWERERCATQDPERYGSLTWQQRVGESEDLIQVLHAQWESVVQDGGWKAGLTSKNLSPVALLRTSKDE